MGQLYLFLAIQHFASLATRPVWFEKVALARLAWPRVGHIPRPRPVSSLRSWLSDRLKGEYVARAEPTKRQKALARSVRTGGGAVPPPGHQAWGALLRRG